MEATDVVTVFLRNGTDVLLLKRSDEVGSYPGKWGAVAGHVEEEDGTPRDPSAAARGEIAEETGLDPGLVTLARSGDPFTVDDPEHGRWVVHPFLYDCPTRDVAKNWETAVHEWAPPTEILRRETVPDLWTSYARVAPSVETVAGDTEHGSAYISLRALEVLRDRAAVLASGRQSAVDDWTDLADLARDLLAARPSMQVVTNRVNRVMSEAVDRPAAEARGDDRAPEHPTAAAVEATANHTIESAVRADEEAARNAADRVGDPEEARVLTLSRSGTVRDALLRAEPAEVLVAESRPAREGVGVAEELVEETPNTDVTLFVDAAVAHVLSTRDVDAVLVGADAVLADGRVVNKVGTRGAALAADRAGVPAYVVAARDKVAPHAEPDFETGDSREVYDGEADLSVLAPQFDATPADLHAGVVTEEGLLDERDVADVADEMAALADWTEACGEGRS